MVFRHYMPSLVPMVVAVVASLALSVTARAETTVFAAASLKTALDSAIEAYQSETGLKVTAAYGGSSVLARQIQLGAPADLFLSASTDWMDVLEAGGMIARGTRKDLLGNSLVAVAPVLRAKPLELDDLPERLENGRLAMALVDAVPAGIYGKAALQTAGIWDAVEPQVAQSDNVRTALALVATGEAPYGIVYATDAKAEPRVEVVAAIPEASHPPIRYPVARLSTAQSVEADQLWMYLTGPEAAEHFAVQGFALLPD
ncbi:MAG: molybdate ABC transporter substrate-binding protein [Pseudomonadota bacterium]